MMLDSWQSRPTEEAYLFNPAFGGALICEFVKSFAGKDKPGAPLTLVLIALSVSLHGQSRAKLPKMISASFYQWVQNNEDILIGFSERTFSLRPHIMEAIRFSVAAQALQFVGGHTIGLGGKAALYTPGKIQTETIETVRIVEQTRMLGRWFSKSGEESFILSAFGVKP
ncbi:three component ABC system middle component [Thalassospira lucentensis]|uniref:Uncharacterized protein n=1 Tax=Thalassospira lucentensis TaxID=168935 RepID=A0A358HPM6_9PROT|nr:three component ABC system middle component [Thalassospira lucentensis]HBU97100.1 hypothetical protein [Thalassospira lucentensis]HCW65942.1 hypothetical protein [Thalassospira lucentensis]|tara:strand:+ start:1616 stop:2122 length:507 start_codon:yes stop_codon:yes gene_type:complete